MKGILGKLDGVKSVAGLLMVVAYYVVPGFTGHSVPDQVLHIGSGLAGVGLIAKLEKGTALLSKGIGAAHKALDIADKVLAALAPKKA